MNRDMTRLVESILAWWREHEYDTCGDYGEYNVYESEPEFVVLALAIQNRVSLSKKRIKCHDRR